MELRYDWLDKWKEHDVVPNPMAPSYCRRCDKSGSDLNHYKCAPNKLNKDMGDHRANIVIEFDFHGKKYHYDAWINYFPEDCGVDRRVIEFFQESYDDGMGRYHEVIANAAEKGRKEAEREHELKELARLKEKYEPAPIKNNI